MSGRWVGLKEAGDGIDCYNLTFIISKLILDFFAFGKISASRLHICTELLQESFT